MGGRGVQVVRRGELADLAQVHHRHPVADVLDHGQVVGDEHQRQAVAGLQVLEQVEDLRLHRHVERGHRLVADHQLRVEDQSTGDADALALAARELVRALVAGHVRVEADGVEHLVNPGAALVRRADLPHLERRGHDVAHPPAGVEGADRVLEHDLEAGTQRAQPLAVLAGQVVALEEHGARGRRGQLHDRPGGGRLAAAALADQAHRLALGHVEAHAGDGRHLLASRSREVDHQVLDAQQHLVVGAQVGGARAGHQPASTVSSPVTAAAAWGTLAARLRSSASRPRSVPTGYQHR